ncbi:MAG: thiolase domain-containing protein [Chloroflexota bacterium]
MREVAVLGVGQVPVGEHWERALVELAGEAAHLALDDAGLERVDSLYLANMLAATSGSAQLNLGAQLADWCGLRGIEAYKVETACGSGGAAFRAGVLAVASGQMGRVLVVGAEKMTHSPGAETTTALATAADADYEVAHGPSFVALNALIMRRYQHEYGWQHDHFAPFSVNAHANGARNPYARLQQPISEQDYRRARMICDPINLLDSSPIGDGAAAVVLVPASAVPPNGNRPRVIVAGSGAATDSLAIHDRSAPLWLSAAERSARQAYDQAGLGPEQVDFFELHDAFSIMAALSLEACGFANPGQAPRLALDGVILPTGRLPIATHGGLKARGHPVGASGVYQIVEVTRQLRGEAGPNQVESPRVGMAQSIGGSGATILTHILRRS